MQPQPQIEYRFSSAEPPHTTAYLSEPILDICRRLGARSVFDIGCGNGAMCEVMRAAGFQVAGCDNSEQAIELARGAYPSIHFDVAGVYDEPPRPGPYDVAISTEVIEHLFSPRALLRFARKILQPGGHLIVSTPYHGYLKNLILAASGKFDAHFGPMWEGGHVKFWSRATLSRLFEEQGFAVADFVGAGRVPFLWKSMILVGRMKESPPAE